MLKNQTYARVVIARNSAFFFTGREIQVLTRVVTAENSTKTLCAYVIAPNSNLYRL